jgi:hypothetical protein
MNQTLDLVCIHPGPDAELILRNGSIERLKGSQVLVRVLATSVNPIDVKRCPRLRSNLISITRRHIFAATHRTALINPYLAIYAAAHTASPQGHASIFPCTGFSRPTTVSPSVQALAAQTAYAA